MVVISFIFCALCVRLFVIQIINGKSLQLKATDQWTRDLKIVAPRGTIYDRTGATLAVSYTTYNVFVRAREVESATTVATTLSNLLSIDFDDVYKKVQKKNVSEVLIKLGVESEIAEKIYQKNLSGVYLERKTIWPISSRSSCSTIHTLIIFLVHIRLRRKKYECIMCRW